MRRWGTFSSQWREASADASGRVHTEGEGPDRKLKKADVPPVAYSGDDWTVTLTFADNTTRTAQIDIQTAGLMIIVKYPAPNYTFYMFYTAKNKDKIP